MTPDKLAVENVMQLGPSKPITSVKDAASYLKRLSKACERKFPTTSERLMDIVRILRPMQAALATEEHGHER